MKRSLFYWNHLIEILPVLGCLCVLAGCDQAKEEPAPLPAEDERKMNFGKAFGEEFLLFGKGVKRSVDQTPVAHVNAYIWQGSLETIAFLPLHSADATGGVIITDWYTVPQAPQERLKITIRIIGKELRSDALKVSINRQVLDKNGTWVEAPVHQEIKTKLENLILSKARQLRIISFSSSK